MTNDALSKRALIAAMALQGILANSPRFRDPGTPDIGIAGLPIISAEDAARDALAYADELLFQLDEGGAS